MSAKVTTMADHLELPPSDEELAAWVRDHPDVWPVHSDGPVADTVDVDAKVASMIDAIVAERWTPGRSRGRRGRMFIAVGAVVVVGAGAAGVAALMRFGQPDAPEAGTACRAEASLETDTVLVSPGVDPIEGCRLEWDHGAFADRADPGGTPSLVACTGSNGGGINVFPGEPGLCEELGLVPADAELDADSQAVVDLQIRLVDEINAADCQPALVVVAQAEVILAESGITGWRVDVLADVATSVCAKTGVDSATQTINIIELEGNNPP